MTVETLTYANTPRRRRWSAKWLIAVGLLTAVGAGWRWWPVVWWRAELAVAQYALVRSVFPQAALAFDHNGKTLRQTPAEWVNFVREYAGSGVSNITLFLGERTSPNGARRFVQVGWPLGWQNPGGGYLEWHAFDFTNWFSKPSEMGGRYCGFPIRDSTPTLGLWGYSPVDVFTATMDPADASHFSIRYQRNSQDTFVDGYLMNDGSIKLETRPSPFNGRPEGAPAGQVPLRGDR